MTPSKPAERKCKYKDCELPLPAELNGNRLFCDNDDLGKLSCKRLFYSNQEKKIYYGAQERNTAYRRNLLFLSKLVEGKEGDGPFPVDHNAARLARFNLEINDEILIPQNYSKGVKVYVIRNFYLYHIKNRLNVKLNKPVFPDKTTIDLMVETASLLNPKKP